MRCAQKSIKSSQIYFIDYKQINYLPIFHARRAHPFMLDYVYTNAQVKSFRVMDADLKMSDHVGLELEI